MNLLMPSRKYGNSLVSLIVVSLVALLMFAYPLLLLIVWQSLFNDYTVLWASRFDPNLSDNVD